MNPFPVIERNPGLSGLSRLSGICSVVFRARYKESGALIVPINVTWTFNGVRLSQVANPITVPTSEGWSYTMVCNAIGGYKQKSISFRSTGPSMVFVVDMEKETGGGGGGGGQTGVGITFFKAECRVYEAGRVVRTKTPNPADVRWYLDGRPVLQGSVSYKDTRQDRNDHVVICGVKNYQSQAKRFRAPKPLIGGIPRTQIIVFQLTPTPIVNLAPTTPTPTRTGYTGGEDEENLLTGDESEPPASGTSPIEENLLTGDESEPPASGTSPILVVVLLGVGAFLAYKVFFGK